MRQNKFLRRLERLQKVMSSVYLRPADPEWKDIVSKQLTVDVNKCSWSPDYNPKGEHLRWYNDMWKRYKQYEKV